MAIFDFYDPYMSFFAGLAPAFRDDYGKELNCAERLPSLIAVGREVAELLGPFKDREEWTSACNSLLSMEPEYRELLAGISKHPNVSVVSLAGELCDPDWTEFRFPQLVSAVYQCMQKAATIEGGEGQKNLAKFVAGPFCLAALMDIDDAIFGVVMGSEGTPDQLLNAGIGAMRSLALAKEMLGSQLSASDEFARKGAAARHALTREIRNFAINLYRNGKYPSAHKASIELKEAVLKESVRLNRPLSEDRAQKTIYDWLRNAEK